MPRSVAHDLLILLFILQVTVLSVWWNHQCQPLRFRAHRASATGPRQLRPRTPDDCPACRAAARTRSQSAVAAPALSYAQLKGRRRPLREKRGELEAAVHERYAGLIDRVGFYSALTPGDADRGAWWADSARIIRG